MLERDESGKIFEWVVDNLKDDEKYKNDLTLGIKCGIKGLVGGIIYSVSDDICYLSIYTTSPKWCTKENLSKIFKIPFEALDCKIVKCLVSNKNKKINKLLWGLKLKEEGLLRYHRQDGSHERVFSLTYDELKKKRWYTK